MNGIASSLTLVAMTESYPSPRRRVVGCAPVLCTPHEVRGGLFKIKLDGINLINTEGLEYVNERMVSS